MITILLFYYSNRTAKNSTVSDYEFRIGGYNKNFSVVVEKERQDNRIYDYQEIEYKYKINEEFNGKLYYLNSQETNTNIFNTELTKKILELFE